MTHILKLYIMGETCNSIHAMANIKRLCQEELKGKFELRVIDVQKYPQLAENDKIVAVPTLIKQLPEPVRRLVGDLSDREKVLLGLDIIPESTLDQISDLQVTITESEDASQTEETLS